MPAIPAYRRGLTIRAALLFLFAALLSASEPPGAIRGRVLHDGVPLSNTVVSALVEDQTVPLAMTVTDGMGAFQLTGLAPGPYLLQARHVGFATFKALA